MKIFARYFVAFAFAAFFWDNFVRIFNTYICIITLCVFA